MKIIYEQGDVVYSTNNYTYGIVLSDIDDRIKVLEISRDVFVNCPPRAALEYCGHINLKDGLAEIIHPFRWEQGKAKGGVRT